MDGSAEALGRSQGRFSTKLHPRIESGGKPIAAVLTAGERHKRFALPALFDTAAVPRRGRGRPRLRPRRVAGDMGCSSPPVPKRLRARRIRPVVPTLKGERSQSDFDKSAHREPNWIERLIDGLKQFHRIATRHEERAADHLGMAHLGMIMLRLLRPADTAGRVAPLSSRADRLSDPI